MVDNLIAPGRPRRLRRPRPVRRADGRRAGPPGADVVRVEAEWGRAIPTERLVEAAAGAVAAMFVVHGETSTGVAQPLDGLARRLPRPRRTAARRLRHLARRTSAGARRAGRRRRVQRDPEMPQLPARAGAVHASATRAPRAAQDRGRSWYFDLALVLGYWRRRRRARAYHHTAPINLVYALPRRWRSSHEEGLEARWARHAERPRRAARRAGAAGLRAPRARRRAAALAAA